MLMLSLYDKLVKCFGKILVYQHDHRTSQLDVDLSLESKNRSRETDRNQLRYQLNHDFFIV